MHDCLNEDLEVLVAKETEQPPKVNTPHGYYYLCYGVIMQIVSIPKRRATSVSTLAIAEDSRTQGVSGGDTDITVEQMVACYVETYKDELPLKDLTHRTGRQIIDDVTAGSEYRYK